MQLFHTSKTSKSTHLQSTSQRLFRLQAQTVSLAVAHFEWFKIPLVIWKINDVTGFWMETRQVVSNLVAFLEMRALYRGKIGFIFGRKRGERNTYLKSAGSVRRTIWVVAVQNPSFDNLSAYWPISKADTPHSLFCVSGIGQKFDLFSRVKTNSTSLDNTRRTKSK